MSYCKCVALGVYNTNNSNASDDGEHRPGHGYTSAS